MCVWLCLFVVSVCLRVMVVGWFVWFCVLLFDVDCYCVFLFVVVFAWCLIVLCRCFMCVSFVFV